MDLNQDKSVHIYCKPEGKAELSIIDTNKAGIKDVKFLLLSEDIIISINKSDNDGNVIIKAPCYRNIPYTNFISYKESFSLSLYQLTIKVKDLLGLTPAVNINPILTSNNMQELESINIEEKDNGEFIINQLIPEEYIIKLS